MSAPALPLGDTDPRGIEMPTGGSSVRHAYGWDTPPLSDPGPVVEVGGRDLAGARQSQRSRMVRLLNPRARSRVGLRGAF